MGGNVFLKSRKSFDRLSFQISQPKQYAHGIVLIKKTSAPKCAIVNLTLLKAHHSK